MGTAIAAARAGCRLVVLGRKTERGRAAIDRIRSIQSHVEWIPADLSNPREIEEFCRLFHQGYSRLDLLFHCAGILTWERQVNPEGMEMMFAVNYLGPFRLTRRLFGDLKMAIPSLVVTVTGRAHKGSLTEGLLPGRIDFSDLQGEKRWSPARAAKQAVLARMLFTAEMARRWEKYGIFACSICPGLTRTALTDCLPRLVRNYFSLRCRIEGAMTPEEAGELIFGLAREPDYSRLNGRYFEVKKGRRIPARTSRQAKNTSDARRLWAVSGELTGTG